MPIPPAEACEEKGKTPYQGERRTYGFFKCLDCNRSWTSAYSWANYGQKCNICNVNVYPFRQRPLKPKKNNTELVKPHLEDLCQKCRALGRFCGERWVGGPRQGRRRRRRRRQAS